MSQPETPSAICDGEHVMICKRSFLGFQSCECAFCHVRHQEPLTTAYRVTYWLVGSFFALLLLERLPLIAQAAATSLAASVYLLFQQWFLVLFVAGAIVALRRDARLRAAAPAPAGRPDQSRQPSA